MTARVINGVSYPVVSDAIGNITSYAGWTYAWQAGRQLASQTNSGGTVEYKCNADGLRVQKKRGSAVTDYVLSGNNIVHMTVTGGHTLHFYYDGQNRPAQVQYNGTMYRYVHSLQGDILAILDSAGNTVVQYAYDAWGGKKTTTGSMAGTLGYYNPFRYRGYVWDEETWMYYLRSRYYYPELQRFINADVEYEGNVFCYSDNSPIIKKDSNGRRAKYNYHLTEELDKEIKMYAAYFDASKVYSTAFSGMLLEKPQTYFNGCKLTGYRYTTETRYHGAAQNLAHSVYDYLDVSVDSIGDVLDSNIFTAGLGDVVKLIGNILFKITEQPKQVDTYALTVHRLSATYVFDGLANRDRLSYVVSHEFITSDSPYYKNSQEVLVTYAIGVVNGKPNSTLYRIYRTRSYNAIN